MSEEILVINNGLVVQKLSLSLDTPLDEVRTHLLDEFKNNNFLLKIFPVDIKFEKMGILSNISANTETTSRRIAQIEVEVKENIHDLDKERMVKEDAKMNAAVYIFGGIIWLGGMFVLAENIGVVWGWIR